MNIKLSKTAKILSAVVLVGLLVGAVALAFPAGVFAQGTQPPAQTPSATTNQSAEKQQKAIEKLQTLYQRELKAVEPQATRLTKADERVTKAQDRINQLKSQGKDVTSLQKALDDFQAVLKAAHTDHDSAAAILKTHAGFDANGKVTDIKLARDTVQEAGQLLKQVHQDLRPAVKDLVNAIRDFVKDNRKK